MGTAAIAHALVVTGPSGAGKSTFLGELAAGNLPPEIESQLPDGARDWPVVCGAHRNQWKHLHPATKDATTGMAGLSMHYDITTALQMHPIGFASDPFWDLLGLCKSVTWIDIRPSHQQLIRQWCKAHLGTTHITWARTHRWRVAGTRLLLRAMRKLRRQRGTAEAPHWRYPRRLRFLKKIDLDLRPMAIPRDQRALDLYTSPGKLQVLLAAWDIAAAQIVAPPAKQRIELVPEMPEQTHAAPRWRISRLQRLEAGQDTLATEQGAG